MDDGGDIARFIAARLDEDEAAAKAAAECGAPDWTAPDEERSTAAVRDSGGGIVVYNEGSPDEAEHIARHDPARVLRDVAAKRKILAEHKAVTRLAGLIEQELGFLGWYREWVLKNLAAVWSDHADYRPEWKLEG